VGPTVSTNSCGNFGTIVKRSELIHEVAQTCGLPDEQVKEVVLALLESLSGHLASGDSVHLWGFGKFEPRLRRSHMKLNPLAGEWVTIPERLSVRFVPSGHLKERINAD
jgi:nucleoid DNA-binding protein